MGKSTLGFVVGAVVGLGSGYFAFKPNTDRCQEFYQKAVTEIDKKYESMPATPGVAVPRDISLEYAVSESAKFKGLIFTDSSSGRSLQTSLFYVMEVGEKNMR